jgi:hypothetical protein
VAVYGAHGFDVGCNVTKTLIERGFDARFLAAASRHGTPRAARALRPTRDSSKHLEPRRVYDRCCFVVGSVPGVERPKVDAGSERHEESSAFVAMQKRR